MRFRCNDSIQSLLTLIPGRKSLTTLVKKPEKPDRYHLGTQRAEVPRNEPMFRTELTGSLPMPEGRFSGRPEFFTNCTELTACCGDGTVCTISLHPQSVRLNRPVGGSVCGLNVGADDFDGVAVVAENGALTVRLLHRDPWLTIDLIKDAGLGAALDLRDAIARQFRLPAVLIDADGRAQSDLNK